MFPDNFIYLTWSFGLTRMSSVSELVETDLRNESVSDMVYYRAINVYDQQQHGQIYWPEYNSYIVGTDSYYSTTNRTLHAVLRKGTLIQPSRYLRMRSEHK